MHLRVLKIPHSQLAAQGLGLKEEGVAQWIGIAQGKVLVYITEERKTSWILADCKKAGIRNLQRLLQGTNLIKIQKFRCSLDSYKTLNANVSALNKGEYL